LTTEDDGTNEKESKEPKQQKQQKRKPKNEKTHKNLQTEKVTFIVTF